MQIQHGNLKEQTASKPEQKGWFIGSFIENNSFFHADEFEVKWAEHKKGYLKEGLQTNEQTKTVTFLISGEFKLDFVNKSSGQRETVVLKKQGDYVAYDAAEFDHTAQAIEDCLVIVFRWPSKREE